MIFSKTTCPLCGHKLKIIEPDDPDKIYYVYYCPVKEGTRNDTNTGVDYLFHFKSTYWQDVINVDNVESTMITPEYILLHKEEWGRTSIFINSTYNAIRYATQVPLLSHINYGDLEQLKNKIKLLVTFS